MCCAAKPLAAPRKAAIRPAHMCRGRGGRGCRCHVRARPAMTAAVPTPPRDLRPAIPPAPHKAPQRPQGPPCPV